MTSTACLRFLRVEKLLQMNLGLFNFNSRLLLKKENISFYSSSNPINRSLEMRSTSPFMSLIKINRKHLSQFSSHLSIFFKSKRIKLFTSQH